MTAIKYMVDQRGPLAHIEVWDGEDWWYLEKCGEYECLMATFAMQVRIFEDVGMVPTAIRVEVQPRRAKDGGIRCEGREGKRCRRLAKYFDGDKMLCGGCDVAERIRKYGGKYNMDLGDENPEANRLRRERTWGTW